MSQLLALGHPGLFLCLSIKFQSSNKSMASQNNSSAVPQQWDRQMNLDTINSRNWFLGCGIGCATGLALLYALLMIWNGKAPWVTIPALIIALIHATVITVFWLNRKVVHRRIALTTSMIASAILLFALAMIIGNNGLQTSPLYGFAFNHLILAFFHPLLYATNAKLP